MKIDSHHNEKKIFTPMKIESFPRKLFLFRNNLCMFAQTQNELHNMKHMSILAVSLLALVACTPEKKQERITRSM